MSMRLLRGPSNTSMRMTVDGMQGNESRMCMCYCGKSSTLPFKSPFWAGNRGVCASPKSMSPASQRTGMRQCSHGRCGAPSRASTPCERVSCCVHPKNHGYGGGPSKAARPAIWSYVPTPSGKRDLQAPFPIRIWADLGP